MQGDPRKWLKQDATHCWHPYTQHGIAPEPLPVVSAEGSWLELAAGAHGGARRMLDAISSWWCCLHGHGHPRLVAALAQQAKTLDHVLFAGCTHEPAAELSARLVALAPPGLSRVFFSDNGSTAVEVALKAAYQACVLRGESERTTYIALEGGYHGDTFGAMAVGDPDPFFVDYAPLMFDVVRVPATEAALEAAFATHGQRTAGFIMEPGVQGAAGMVPIPDAFLRRARALCDTHGVMLIADEVFTGFGRTGDLFACGRAGVTPDALCLSKGLTSGMLPLAVTLFPESVYTTFLSDQRAHMFFHGHTYTANPLACAVALAGLDLIAENDTPAVLAGIGAAIEGGLAGLADVPGISLRRVGGIVAIEVGTPDGGYLSELSPQLKAACLTHSPEVLLRPLGNVLYAVPPASTTPEECALIATRMTDVLAAVLPLDAPAG